MGSLSRDSMGAPSGSGRGGYILLETTVALVLLGMGVYAIHGAIRQAIVTRGQAQDYTQARFLLERVIAEVEIQPALQQGSKQGRFEAPLDRFEWRHEIRKIRIPKPEGAINVGALLAGDDSGQFEYPIEYLLRVRATVTWKRAGHAFSESFETLIDPTKLWLPPPPEDLQ